MNLFFDSLEAISPRSRFVPVDSVSGESFFLTCKWHFLCMSSHRLSSVYAWREKEWALLSLLIMQPILLDQNPTLMTSFNLNYFLRRNYISKATGIKASTHKFREGDTTGEGHQEKGPLVHLWPGSQQVETPHLLFCPGNVGSICLPHSRRLPPGHSLETVMWYWDYLDSTCDWMKLKPQ